jgi:hypothetical protein
MVVFWSEVFREEAQTRDSDQMVASNPRNQNQSALNLFVSAIFYLLLLFPNTWIPYTVILSYIMVTRHNHVLSFPYIYL